MLIGECAHHGGRPIASAVVVAIVLGLLLGAAKAEAVPSVTFECTPAPEDCSDWFQTNVTIVWTVLPSNAVKTGCTNRTFSADTRGTWVFCSAREANVTASVELPIRVDKTLPVVTGGEPSRAADVNGWYNRAVGISFSGSDLTSGIAKCTAPSYGGPDSSAASVAGQCWDHAGNMSSPFGYGLKYDQTGPLLTGATPERPPSAGGWFTEPVRFDIQATDATSGIADCPSVTYGGPNSAAASFTGRCRDLAGNWASRSFSLKYDSSARAGPDAAPPGPTGQPRKGPSAKRRRPHLIGPRRGAVVRLGNLPTLRWVPVRRARYYNLQLWRRGHKVLSAWPVRPRYQLKRRWTFDGRIRRLAPGPYRWLVWPGFGPRSRGDYGRRIGPATFRVARPRRH